MFSLIFYITIILCSIEIEVVSTRYNEIVTPDRLIVKPTITESNKSKQTSQLMSLLTLFAWVILLTILGGGILNACFKITYEHPGIRARNYLIVFVVSSVVMGMLTAIKYAFGKK